MDNLDFWFVPTVQSCAGRSMAGNLEADTRQEPSVAAGDAACALGCATLLKERTFRAHFASWAAATRVRRNGLPRFSPHPRKQRQRALPALAIAQAIVKTRP